MLRTASGALVAGGTFARTAAAADPTVEADVDGVDCNGRVATIGLENDVENSSTVTISRDGDAVWEDTLTAGEKRDVELDTGVYTVTATSLGEPMRVNDQPSVTLDASCGDEEEVDEGRTVGVDTGLCEIGVENDYGETATVFFEAHQESDTQESVTVPSGGGADVPASAGTYTVTAEASGGDRVPVNGQDSLTVTVECSGQGEPSTVLADGGCEELSVANEYGETVDVAIRGPQDYDVRLEHLGDMGFPTEVGEYTVAAYDTNGTQVPVNSEDGTVSSVTVLVVECPTEAVNVDARNYDCDVLEVENENKEVDVTVTVNHGGDLFDTIELGPDERKRVDGFTPEATYTLEASADGRSATVNGDGTDEITIETC